ncbi:proenkephalin-B [Brachionichthys hirsutus]|uniref:proenkephalin-B n=1 Tax=Brachionichthys hirsutus TaxID=412623 RepID=UPI0036044ABD
MAWYVLLLVLSLPASIHADCSPQCQNCLQEILDLSSLSCSGDCEGQPRSCGPTPGLEPADRESPSRLQRYGGFIQSAMFASPRHREDAPGGPERGEDAPGGPERGEDAFGDPLLRPFDKRYGGFLRKFGPKSRRSGSAELRDPEQQLQKRYGGFLRRIRPKLNSLKWDERHGGLLRRQFQMSARSAEEPFYSAGDLNP